MPREDALRRSMEESLAADPDDLATHMAYADHLNEQGDPRGEFIQVQLALEDPKLTAAERKKLRAREVELLEQHHREWIGDAAPLFCGGPEVDGEDLNEQFDLDLFTLDNFEFRFARGWLDRLVLDDFSGPLAKALGKSPAIRLLRELTVCNAYDTDAGFQALSRWPALGCLQRFQVGVSDSSCFISAPKAHLPIARMQRLEELDLFAHQVNVRKIFSMPFSHLRKLHVYHIRDYPLDLLARNPTLGNLAELYCFPHCLLSGDRAAYIQPGPFRKLCFSPHLKSLTRLGIHLSDAGDDGVRALLDSGLLKRLRVLDLWNGRVTDEGARLLAASPDLCGLELLNLSKNNLTPAGVQALRETGVNLKADGQLTADQINEGAHLWDGDME